MSRSNVIPSIAFTLITLIGWTSAYTKTIKVPQDARSIAAAVKVAQDGDILLISPGRYKAKEIEINKRITITSEWSIDGDNTRIDETVIDCDWSWLFRIFTNDVEVSGLRIINGDHTVDFRARGTVKNNHFYDHKDAVSMESDGGGYIGYNEFENSSRDESGRRVYDDAIDCDIGEEGPGHGSDILIEYNTIKTNKDDGIEIRIFIFQNPIQYEIRNNWIENSGGNGIQLISYDEPGEVRVTGKEFRIHNNVFLNNNGGVTCTPGRQTGGGVTAGSPAMEELVVVHNNVFTNNRYGLISGGNTISLNNVFVNQKGAAAYNVHPGSVVDYSIFFSNLKDFENVPADAQGSGNIFADPLIHLETYRPLPDNVYLDAGVATYEWKGVSHVLFERGDYEGAAPVIGAFE